MGVWIEIFVYTLDHRQKPVAPSWECGLKLMPILLSWERPAVAPHAGVWIEISDCRIVVHIIVVAPPAGAWIEMRNGKLVTLWGQRGDFLTKV